MHKAWHGDVALEGAVYTAAHGPQPQSIGHTYFEKKNDAWKLEKDNKLVAAQVQYKGHVINGNTPTFKYELYTPDNKTISIQEKIAQVGTEEQPILERLFTVKNTSDYNVVLATSGGVIQGKENVESDGSFEVISSTDETTNDVSYKNLFGHLKLKNGTTTFKTTFHENYQDLKVTKADMAEAALATGAELIDQSDCRSCHNEKVKTVGPSYLSVAKKYNDDEGSVDLLANRILKGGNGVWGIAMMTPHPDLPLEQSKEMVRYILSLDDDLSTEGSKLTLGIKSIPVQLEDNYKGTAGPGFFAHMYHNPDGKDFLEITKEEKPVKQGVVKQIHALDEHSFKDLSYNFVIEYEGQLNIEKEGSYDFRLISDDGSYLFINDRLIIDNGGWHGPEIKDGEMYLPKGKHDIRIVLGQGGGGAFISFQWFDKETESFVLLDDKHVSFDTKLLKETDQSALKVLESKSIPGDQAAVAGVHPSFDLHEARPADFKPRVGGIDFLDDERMVVSTWDTLGGIYLVEGWQSGDPAKMTHKRIATGLAEPLGIKVVDNEIYVLQKQELTKLVDTNGDEIIDEYQTVSNDWKVSANFHEFSFGLVYKDGHFYGALATAILPGGASADPQIPDRGKVVKINKETGKTELIASGLRTPNGIGIGVDDEIFIADNQGDWLPASKVVHIKEGAFYGSRSVDFEGTANATEMPPVVWLPQDEIGNSPSTPIVMKSGPYKDQMIHGEVTNGGIKRVYVEQVNGAYQGALFRFSQGFGAGINRILWAPDGSLMTGGVGSTGNWSHAGKAWYSLQRMVYNEKTTFEMLAVKVKSDGFEIEFTEPLADGINVSAKDFAIEQWWYEPTIDYGGPKKDLEQLSIKNLELSPDRKSVNLTLPGIKEGHVVYIRIASPLKSVTDQSLWSTECWYTLNNIPSE